MKKILLLFSLSLCLLLSVRTAAQRIDARLDSTAYAALLTCGSGDDFYTTFGHTAIRICDTALGLDLVYNYGTFDFNTPHFYWKFACGNLNYCLSRTSYSDFMWEYSAEGRAVWQQRLRLTNQELNNLLVLLETNYQPEYRYYRYDFFRDNCATRVRDAINNALSHRTLFEARQVADARSYRQLLRAATGDKLQWWQTGIDMLLGARCDHRCDNMEYMFLPLELKLQLDTTHLKGTGETLADPVELVLTDVRQPLSHSVSPVLCFWILAALVVALTFVARRRQWRIAWLDVVLFLAASLASLLIIFLWAFSSHYCTAANWNILWASPLFLFFLIFPRRSPRWLLQVQAVLLLVVMISAIFSIGFPQIYSPAVIPICLTLFIRLLDKIREK